MTLSFRPAKADAGRHQRARALCRGIGVTAVALGVLFGSATSAAAAPAVGAPVHLSVPAHIAHPNCWLCID